MINKWTILWGLLNEDIYSCSTAFAFIQSLDQFLLVDDSTTSHIDNADRWFAFG
jgi:hypothetical protein